MKGRKAKEKLQCRITAYEKLPSSIKDSMKKPGSMKGKK